jgi:hypothetical protein
LIAAISSKEIIYIRYISSRKRKSPFQRHTTEFSSKTSPILAKFLETISWLCLITLDIATIYEFDKASNFSTKICSPPEWKENKAMYTLLEQALIILIGFSLLLNQTIGGFLYAYKVIIYSTNNKLFQAVCQRIIHINQLIRLILFPKNLIKLD